MGKIKIDNRIKVLIENGIKTRHRSMFVVVGDKGRDQVMILHHLLTKASVKSRPSVLWCYKKELGFSSHHKKKMKKVQKKIKVGKFNVNEDDPFELFIASTNIRYCYYKETQKILGQTYGICVLQDFEAITPNVLARAIETVEGGGLIIILLRAVTSLKQFYTMAMDVHERYRTEAHRDVVGRFNERFVLSLSSCNRCLVVDDTLQILPLSSHIYDISALPEEPPNNSLMEDLKNLQMSLKETESISATLVRCCRTLDQANAVVKFIDAISEKSLKYTVSLTSARGRGKSAAMGLAVAAAIAYGYNNIFITSPCPSNLNTFFEFVCKGLNDLSYQEHLDYGLVRSLNPDDNKALVRVNVFKNSRQIIQYINPKDAVKLTHAELLVIDEAAAIPLPYVKRMFGQYLIFLASTINGYEGTGRSLSLKLLQELRNQPVFSGAAFSGMTLPVSSQQPGRILHEITLNESIRYGPDDPVEQWLNDLLCLNAYNITPMTGKTPLPEHCDLYYINRDTLFCYHKATEVFLQKIMSLYVSSHYKNSPNDLQLMSDAPSHHLFCLMGPLQPNQTSIPDIYCVLQVCLEGQLSEQHVYDQLLNSGKPYGDLIPWTITQQFLDKDFPSLSGLRVVRIATHPDFQSMGYGSRALSLLENYYQSAYNCENVIFDTEQSQLNIEVIPKDTHLKKKLKQGDIARSQQQGTSHDIFSESIEPRKDIKPLLMKLEERPAEKINYIGVSYGLTLQLLKFWKRSGFTPVYIRHTSNDITGEHSCIMLKIIKSGSADEDSWLTKYWFDFKKRFSTLLCITFSSFPTTLGLSILTNNKCDIYNEQNSILENEFTAYDIKRLQLYCNNRADYHLILDLVPALAGLYFFGKMGDVKFTVAQCNILLGIGLQRKMVDDIAQELDMIPTQVLGLFNRMMRKMCACIKEAMELKIEDDMFLSNFGQSDMKKTSDSGETSSIKKKKRKTL